MSEAIKPTPGPWTQGQGACGSSCVWTDGHTQPPSGAMGEDSTWIDCNTKGNAALIAEAGTVHHETGLTPRQLVEQRDALAEALMSVIENCEQHGDFRNGVTDPTGTIDEGMVAADEFFGKARAALALVKGATP